MYFLFIRNHTKIYFLKKLLAQYLLGEFHHEPENNHKLLKAIPGNALNFKLSPKSWTTGQLASHIAEVYNWYQPTLHQNVFDTPTYKYHKGDINVAVNVVARFEENVKNT